MDSCHKPAQRPVYGRSGTTIEHPEDPVVQQIEKDSQADGKVAEVQHA